MIMASGSLIMEEASTVTQRMTSAFFGAIVTSLIVTPFDVVKTRMQVPTSSSANFCCNNYAFCGGSVEYFCPINAKPRISNIAERQLNSTWDGFVKIARNEGMSGLWRGLLPTLLMSMPATVIYFTGYEQMRNRFLESNVHLLSSPLYAPLFAGAAARTVAATIISPIELVRTRLQAQPVEHSKHYTVVLRGLQAMINDHGILTLWRGLSPTLWRDVPFSAIYWMSYEYTKRNLSSLSVKKEERPKSLEQNSGMRQFLVSFAAGALSGMLAAAITIPFDVVKTRRQIAKDHDNASLSSSSTNNKPKFVIGMLKEIYVQEGWRGWTKGIGPRIAKVAPACAIMISSYEVGKMYFNRKSNVQTPAPVISTE